MIFLIAIYRAAFCFILSSNSKRSFAYVFKSVFFFRKKSNLFTLCVDFLRLDL